MEDSIDQDCYIVDESVINKSVTCTHIPDDFLDKSVAKSHFSQFGKIHSFTLRPKRFTCIVEYETEDAAENALIDGCNYGGSSFDIVFTPKVQPKQRSDPDYIDPDVQMELEAMSSSPASSVTTQSSSTVGRFGQSSVRNVPEKQLATKRIGLVSNTAVPVRQKQQQLALPTIDIAAASQIQPIKHIDQLAKNELEALLRERAYTSEEKFRVLDARDKLIRLLTNKTTDIKRVVSIKGVCPDMCPEKERLMREATHHVATYELEEGSKNIMKHSIAVKQYARSSADQEFPLAHELRPEPILKMTMRYLLHRILDLCEQPNCNLGDWFHFVWDRTRSIRKDVSQQELCSITAVNLVEQCARLHIHCAARLVAEEPQVFDQKINSENLTKCLQSLKYLYHDLNLKQQRCPNEPEFRAYVILLNLNDCQFFWEVKLLPYSMQNSPEIRFAIQVYLAIANNNYVKFFQLVRQTTYMNACILLRYFTQVRVSALSAILKAYVPRGQVPMPISYWQYILAFEDYDQAAQFFEYYGMQCDREQDRVWLDRGSFVYPDMPFLLERAINIVEHKRICSVGEAVCGEPLTDFKEFEKYEPHDSFDENGYLTPEAWRAEDQNYLRPPTPKRKLPHHPFNDGDSETATDRSSASPLDSPAPLQADAIFKIPQAPQIRTSQSPKPSIFTKLSPRSPISFDDKEDPPELVTAPAPHSKILSTKMGTTITPTTKTDNLFQIKPVPSLADSSGVFGKSSQKMFGNSSTDSFIPTPTVKQIPTIGGEKSVFQLSQVVKKPTDGNSSSNIFGSSSVFGGTAGTSTNNSANTNQQAESTGLFTNFVQQQKINKSQSGIFAEFAQKNNQPDNNQSMVKPAFTSLITNAFGGGGAVSNNIFSSIPINNEHDKSVQNAETIRLAKEKLAKLENEKRILKEKQDTILQENLLQQQADEIIKNAEVLCENILDEFVKENVRETIKIEMILKQKQDQLADDILNEILVEVIQQELNDFFHEAMQILNLKISQKYFKKWLKTVRDIQRRRLKIENTPIWLPEKPLPENIHELTHPQQGETLLDRARYRKGHANQIKMPEVRSEWLNIGRILTTSMAKLSQQRYHGGEYKRNKWTSYFKCVISLPDSEEYYAAVKLDKWLTRLLINNTNSTRPPDVRDIFYCENYQNGEHKLGICLRKLKGINLLNECGEISDVKEFIGSNGVLFFMSDDFDQVSIRLKRILRKWHRDNNCVLAIIHLNSSTATNGQQMDSEYIRDYFEIPDNLMLEYVPINSDDDDVAGGSRFGSDKNLKTITADCLSCLTTGVYRDNDLEMQSTTSFLLQTLGDQLWTRFEKSIEHNPAIFKVFTHFESVVCLYNQAIDKLSKIVSIDVENLEKNYPEFPDELRRFVPPMTYLDIPKSLEYFPKNWKNTERKILLKEFFNSLRLKEFQFKMPENIDDLQAQLLQYCELNLPSNRRESDRAAYRMIQCIMLHLNNIETLRNFLWLEALKFLTNQMLTIKFATTQKKIPNEIIYPVRQFKEYTSKPWWITDQQSPLKNIRLTVEKSEEFHERKRNLIAEQREAEKVWQIIDSTELDDLLTRTSRIINKADKKILDYKNISDKVRAVSSEFDAALTRHEKDSCVRKRVLTDYALNNISTLAIANNGDQVQQTNKNQQSSYNDDDELEVKKPRLDLNEIESAQNELAALLAKGNACVDRAERSIKLYKNYDQNLNYI